jgi:hypothetical protein
MILQAHNWAFIFAVAASLPHSIKDKLQKLPLVLVFLAYAVQTSRGFLTHVRTNI